MLEKMEVIEVPHQEQKVRLRFPDPPPAPTPMLELRDASKSYGPLSVLREVNLSVYSGERILLVGANGAGKSTLLRLISGVEQADGGVVQVIRGTRQAWFAQDQARELPADRTVMEATLAADLLLTEARCRSLLGALLFRGDDVHKLCGVLSGGEKSRVALGRVLLGRANLLLLDEPTNHLDIESKDVLAEALENFSGTILFVSHDREFANRLSTSVWEVGGSEVVPHQGNLDEFLWNKAIAAGVVHRRGPGESAPDAWLLGGLPEASQAPDQAAPESTVEGDAPSDTDELSWKDRKRLASLRRRQRREADELMEKLDELEEKMASLDVAMSDRANASDWDKLQGWSSERTELDSERDRSYQRWEELETLLSDTE
jgi:ATP-binding cassette subfamily F protein 3